MNIGILGGGQLAQMIAQAGKKLDCNFTFLDPSPTACAFPLGKSLIGKYDDPKLLKTLATSSDVVTFEFENVPHASVEVLSKHVPIHPPALALEISQDRLKEKTTFERLAIPTTKFAAVNSLQDLTLAISNIGLPCVLKTRSQGYDGKGQYVLRQKSDVEKAWKSLGGVPLILEEFIPFDREVSLIGVRSKEGETQYYDVCQNEHHEGILRFTQNCPDDPMYKNAKTYVERLMDHMNYVGVLALEMFQKGKNLLANEMAPRVHNSGHWTIEGAKTSQFENHLRAIMELPLGDTTSKGFSVMANLIGVMPDTNQMEKIDGPYIHIYGKEPRPKRKLGHITLCGDDEKTRKTFFKDLRKMTLNSESDL